MESSPDYRQRQAGADLDIWSLLEVVWRRRRVVIATMAVVLVGAAAVVFTMVPRYASQSKILIENRETIFTQTRGEQRRFLSDQAAMLSQVELLRSRDLAEKIASGLNLDQSSEFNQQNSISLISRLFAMLGKKPASPANAPVSEKVLEAYFKSLSVFQLGTSRVIEVQFTSRDPVLAAKLANTLVDEFLKVQQADKSGANRDATDWLGRQIEKLRGKVLFADQAVEDFRSKSGLLRSGRDATLKQQQLNELNTQLINATGSLSEARARAKLVQKLLKRTDGLEAAGDVLNSPLIQRLREQQAVLSRRIADSAATLLPGHPRMRSMRAEMKDLNKRIKLEVRKIARGLENEADIAAARVDSLRQNLSDLKTATARGTNSEVELRALEREAKSQRDVYESLLARYREASVRQDIGAQPANARIISRAGVSNRPVFPPKGAILSLASVAAFLLGIVMAFMVETMAKSRDRRTPKHETVAVPGEATMAAEMAAPTANSMQDNQANADRIRQPRLTGLKPLPPANLSAAVIASLPRVTRQLADICAAHKLRRVVLVPVDGLSLAAEMALYLTRLLGQRGTSAILVEAEPIAGALGTLLGTQDAPGLAELLAGQVTMTEVLQKEQDGLVGIISAGNDRLVNRALFATKRLWLVLNAALREFKIALILTDGLGSDAQEIAVQGDFTIILARRDALENVALASIISSFKKAGVGAAAVLAVGNDSVELFEAIAEDTSENHAA